MRSSSWLASPPALATIGLSPAFAFLFFPSALYEQVINERFESSNFIYTGLFLVATLIVFVIGFLAARIPRYSAANQSGSAVERRLNTGSSIGHWIVISSGIALLFSSALGLASGAYSAMIQGLGEAYRDGPGTIQSLLFGLFYAGVINVIWNNSALRVAGLNPTNVSRLLFVVGLVFGLVAPLVILHRNIFFVLAFSFICAYASTSNRATKEVVKFLPLLLVGFGFLFLLLDQVRGNTGSDSGLEGAIGYAVAPVNRLSIALAGELNFSREEYLFSLFSSFFAPPGVPSQYSPAAFLQTIVGDFPIDRVEVWKSQFFTAQISGLNPKYIWITAPGVWYLGLGSFYFLFVFLLGYCVTRIWVLTFSSRPEFFGIYCAWGGSALFWSFEHTLFYPNVLVYMVSSYFLLWVARAAPIPTSPS